MKIGFFGGSFNPPHLGHLLAATYALKTFNLDQIWFAPVYKHPFGKHSIPYAHRLHMCRLLVAEFSPPFLVTDIESKLDHDGKTYQTLRALKTQNPNDTFSLIIGSDLEKQLKTWNHYEELSQEFDIHLVPRGDKSHPASIPNISSTNIREDAYEKNIIQNVVTPEIHAYMEDNDFYDG
jgi:nicotinate-nucleotide adenylyltransferase